MEWSTAPGTGHLLAFLAGPETLSNVVWSQKPTAHRIAAVFSISGVVLERLFMILEHYVWTQKLLEFIDFEILSRAAMDRKQAFIFDSFENQSLEAIATKYVVARQLCNLGSYQFFKADDTLSLFLSRMIWIGLRCVRWSVSGLIGRRRANWKPSNSFGL
jgi:hypothetical protein